MDKNAKNKFRRVVNKHNNKARDDGRAEELDLCGILKRWESTVFCCICGRYIELKDASLEHVKPRVLGGANLIENILIVHSWCNNRKGEQDLFSARNEMLMTYPLEETGDMLRDIGVLDALLHVATHPVKRSSLPSNFSDMKYTAQVRTVAEISENNAESGYGLFPEVPRIVEYVFPKNGDFLCIAKCHFSGRWCTEQIVQEWDKRMKEQIPGSNSPLIMDSESISAEYGQSEVVYVKSVNLYFGSKNAGVLPLEVNLAWAHKMLELKLGLIWAAYHAVMHQSG